MSKHVSMLALMIAGLASAAPAASLARTAAKAGTLDPTFGHGGRVLVAKNQVGSAVAFPTNINGKLQPDGKIVVIAPLNEVFGIVRLLPTGQLDSSFGANGVVQDAMRNYSSDPEDLAIQPDGKIVVVGGAESIDARHSPVALARFNPDGSLDTTFGTGGNVLTQAQQFGFDSAFVVLLQPDGKIVIGGESVLQTEHPPPPKGFVQRYNPDGSLDASFGHGGKVLLAPPSGIAALALQTDGKILTDVGLPLAGQPGFPFVRLLPDGSVDQSHAPGTIAATAHTGTATFQPDGRFVVSFTITDGSCCESDIQTVRFRSTDGAVDSSFASPIIGFGSSPAEAHALAIALQADGKVLVGGTTVQTSVDEFGLDRLLSDGRPDLGFGRSGGLLTPFSTKVASGGVVATGLTVQPDGKIVEVGYSFSVTTGLMGIALARYLP